MRERTLKRKFVLNVQKLKTQNAVLILVYCKMISFKIIYTLFLWLKAIYGLCHIRGSEPYEVYELRNQNVWV